MRSISRPLVTLTLALALSGLSAQTPTHQHVQHNTVGSALSTVNGVATDSEGNLIACGGRLDALDFGTNNHAAGTGGIFLAKFSPSGAVLWSKVAGNSDMGGNHKAMSVAVDGNDNIYLAGWLFNPQPSVFDGTTIAAGSLGFVARYTPAGVLTWVKDFPANVHGIAVDGGGNPYINLGESTIEKLDPANGSSVASAIGGGDLMNAVYHNIVVDGANNVIAQWGNKITKYDSALNQLWSAPLVKSLAAESFRINVDADGDVWATFYAIFGTVTLGGTDYTAFPAGYIYELDGATGVVNSCLSPGAYKIKEVLPNTDGTLLVSGDFAFNDPYIVKYDAALTALWSVATFNVMDMARMGEDCLVLGGNHDADITLDGSAYTRPNSSGQDNAIASYLCVGGVGVQERAASDDGQLIPNPATDAATVVIRKGASVGAQLFDLNGRLVASADQRMRFDLTGLPAGVYAARIALADGRSIQQRLVVE